MELKNMNNYSKLLRFILKCLLAMKVKAVCFWRKIHNTHTHMRTFFSSSALLNLVVLFCWGIGDASLQRYEWVFLFLLFLDSGV